MSRVIWCLCVLSLIQACNAAGCFTKQFINAPLVWHKISTNQRPGVLHAFNLGKPPLTLEECKNACVCSSQERCDDIIWAPDYFITDRKLDFWNSSGLDMYEQYKINCAITLDDSPLNDYVKFDFQDQFTDRNAEVY